MTCPGTYNLLIGLYDQATGERLFRQQQIATPDGRYLLGQIMSCLPGRPPGSRSTRFHDTSDSGPMTLAPARHRWESFGLANGKLRGARRLTRWCGATRRRWLIFPVTSAATAARASGPRERDGARTARLRRPECFSPSFTATEARYATRVADGDRPVGSFDIVLSLQDDTLRVGLQNVREEPGYLLYDVWLPQPAAASAPAGQLVLPTQAGRLVPLKRSSAGRHVVSMNWFEGDLCGAVVGDGCSAAIRTRDWDNELDAMVAERGGQMTGGYAVRLALRAQATTKAARIVLARAPSVEVILTPAGEGGASWIDAAKRLRREVTGTPNPVYADTIIYKIFCDSPGSRDFTTFDEALGVIRQCMVSRRGSSRSCTSWAGSMRHDTGYPATDKINERLGD